MFFTIFTSKYYSGYCQLGESCTIQLIKAEQLYRSGNLDEAMKLVLDCLAKPSISERDKEEARRLKGLIFVAMNLEIEAKDALQNLYKEIPEYKMAIKADSTNANQGTEIKTSVISPIIINLLPSKIGEGESDFILRVKGINFDKYAKVRFNGKHQTTTFIDSTELIAEIKSEDAKGAGFFNVNVVNEAPEFTRSNDMSFEVTTSKSPWLLVGGIAGAIAVGITVILLLL